MIRRFAWCVPFVLLATACSPSAATHRSSATASVTPPPAGQASAFASTTGEPQYLSGLARVGRRIVAVGGHQAGGTWRPIFLSSEDDGRTWRRGQTDQRSATTADDTAKFVVARHGRFLALGDAAHGVSVWTSADGTHWVRHQVNRKVMGGGTTRVSALVATSTGFAAVGATSVAGSPVSPVTWTSANGLTWTKRTSADLGLAVDAGRSVDMGSVTVAPDGRTLIAVGTAQTIRSVTDVPRVPRVWRSPDAGVTWRSVPLPADLAGTGSQGLLNTVRWLGGRFVAVGHGGSGHVHSGVVATSVGGRQWRGDSAGPGLVTTGQAGVQAVTSRLGSVYAFGQSCSTRCALIGVAGTSGRWRPVTMPAGAVGDDVNAYDAITTSSGTIIVVGEIVTGTRQDGRIWRSAAGRQFHRVTV